MSDESLTVRVLIGDADHSTELARAVTYPEGMGDIAIEQDIPGPVARIGVSALESICLGLRQVAAGDHGDLGLSALSFDERMRPIATDAQVQAVAVMLAGVFDRLTDTPADTPADSYAKLDDEEQGELGRLAELLLDVAREAGE